MSGYEIADKLQESQTVYIILLLLFLKYNTVQYCTVQRVTGSHHWGQLHKYGTQDGG